MYGISYDQVFPGDPFSPHYAGADVRTTTGGRLMYYNEGFLPAGGAQSPSGGFDISGILGGLVSTIPTVIQSFQRPSFGQLPPASTVPTIGQPPVMSSHPVIGTAGQAVAPTYGPSMSQGGRGRYYPPGTKGTHQVRKGAHAGSWVKNRHRNVCNPRALRRAISRTHGFARLAMKVIHLVHPKKHARFGGFRKRRARR